jgi:2-polyprenyl-3-methyl-5-hydroxy-6-metoxy-1,4-benzoquinol methylase
MSDESKRDNETSREAWNTNADFWDERMGEGNDFVNVLTWPATTRLLAPQPGEKILDIACGNGLTSRRLAAAGARVVAFDFAAEMIAHARARTAPGAEVEYHVLDATDESALLALGAGSFDGALSNMALFDMAEIDPLLHALTKLLRPGGRFVFSVLHPCFNNSNVDHVAEQLNRAGEIRTVYSVKVFKYHTPSVDEDIAMLNQPRKQLVFNRPLEVLLGACFRAGFVLDGLEEPAFPPDHPAGRNPLSWGGNFSEIPPVLVARVRLR